MRYGLAVKTTLNLDDELLRQAKEEARRRGTTLTAVVTDGLRAVLAEPATGPQPFTLQLPVMTGRGPAVDPADRDAVHDLMDGAAGS